MAEELDPEVAAAVRRITDRFIRLEKATPQHEVRVKLGPQRYYLDQLVQDRVLEAAGESYLPRLRALDLMDDQIRKLCYRHTEIVPKACKKPYSLSGHAPYTMDEI